MKIAAIDIGSNAARLLINEVTENTQGEPTFTKLNLLRIPLRLGMDVFTNGKIGEEREHMTLDTMKIFSSLMKMYDVQCYRACATSAMRDAQNGDELRQTIKEQTGIEIEIISGDQEATLLYENHASDSMDKGNSYLYIDVGGGSTELTYLQDDSVVYKHSFNIGTIRLLSGLVSQQAWQEMKTEIENNIKSKKPIVAIGSGGNINKVFSMSKTKDSKSLSNSTLKKLYEELEPLSVKQRMNKYNLREDRADVIVPALKIFNRVMEWSGAKQIYVPKISVADGVIHNLYEQYKKEGNS